MTDYCRLCAELKDPCEIVTTIFDVEQSVEQKLSACCQWTQENTEQRLPHSVCSICLEKLEKCWLFSQSVQLAQQKLLEIFENETEAETGTGIEANPLATEMVQIVYDCPNSPNDSSSPQTDAKSASVRKKKKKVKRGKLIDNPLESKEEEEAFDLDETEHKCPECGRCFTKRWNLKEHMLRHSDNRTFKCWLCPKAFNTKHALSKHTKNQTQNKCEICSRDFCTTIQLNAHKQSCERLARDANIVGCGPSIIDRSNEVLIKVEFNEQHCIEPIGAESTSSKTGTPNVESYQAADPTDEPNHVFKRKYTSGPFECDVCGRIFNKKCNLKMHRIIHTDERPFECWLCHKMFRLRGTLRKHLLIHTIHSKIRLDIDKAKKRAKHIELYGSGEPTLPFRFKCDECGRLFTRKLTLKNHQFTHITERPFECSLCHKMFKSKKALQSHMKRHLNQRKSPTEQNWVCELCGQAYTHKSSLVHHTESKHTHSDKRPYKCNVCALGFKTHRLLKLHGRKHTDFHYDCNQCEKSFRSTQSLKRHLEYHTGTVKKPFACDMCGKGFRINANLVEHRRIHTGEKPHSCEYCASNFRTISSYCSHMKKIHGLPIRS